MLMCNSNSQLKTLIQLMYSIVY